MAQVLLEPLLLSGNQLTKGLVGLTLEGEQRGMEFLLLDHLDDPVDQLGLPLFLIFLHN